MEKNNGFTILKMADISSRAIEEPKVQNEEISETQKAKADMQSKIATAKFHASIEIKQFKKLTDEYLSEVEKLCLFSQVPSMIRETIVDGMVKEALEPIIKGDRPIDVPDEVFKDLRKTVFKKLFEKYL